MTTASLRSVYPGPGGFDPHQLRREFPIFANNPDLVFLDSGASAQKPESVIDGVAEFYRREAGITSTVVLASTVVSLATISAYLAASR